MFVMFDGTNYFSPNANSVRLKEYSTSKLRVNPKNNAFTIAKAHVRYYRKQKTSSF